MHRTLLPRNDRACITAIPGSAFALRSYRAAGATAIGNPQQVHSFAHGFTHGLRRLRDTVVLVWESRERVVRRHRRKGGSLSTAQPEVFANLLRRLRAQAGLTQQELAERSGVSARSVSDLERGVAQRP